MSTPVITSERRASAPRVGPARLLHALVGILLILSGAWLLWDFPLARFWLFGLAVILIVVQWLNARAWLVAVPMLFGMVDLGAWSGRFLFSEQDAFLALLVGVALLAGQYGDTGRNLVRRCFAPLWLLTPALVVGFIRGFQPMPELDANAWNGYLTGWNAFRVVKGPLWGLILWPLLARQLDEDSRATVTGFAVGMAAALTGFGTLVLWERGLAADLMLAKDAWGLVGTWLNLSGSYRITGPFSQMQLGGEAVDGFLILTWPFAFSLLLHARRWPLLLLALLALALGAYGVMVTFTRTTYAAVAIAFLGYTAAAVSGAASGHRGRLAAAALGLAAATAVFIYGFRLGGTLTTIGYLIAMLGATGATMFVPRRAAWAPAAGGLLVLLVVGASVAMYGMTTSKWSGADPRTAFAIVAVSAVILGISGMGVGAALRPWARTRTGTAVLLSLVVLLPVVTLSFTGSQMETRFSSVGHDFDWRQRHWREVLMLMPDNVETKAFGLGLGRFPMTYLLGADEPKGAWQFGQEGSGHFLRLLGSASLCYGQRVLGLAPGAYRVEVGLRNPSGLSANLAVKLQPRRLLESESWQPDTEQLNFVVDPGGLAWQRVEGELHLHAHSVPQWYDPRFSVLALTNQGDSRSAVDVAYVRLIDPSGRDRLDNGKFAAGGDRWFAYNDFQHLEWHIKNLYIALYFEMGGFGIAAFALTCIVALVRGWRKAHRSFHVGCAAVAALVGFLSLGTTGTLLDVPQLMTLFLLVVIAALWYPPSNVTIVTGENRSKSGATGIARSGAQ